VTGSGAQHGKSVIRKVVSVFEAFSTRPSRLSLKQLAESTGLPQSTTIGLRQNWSRGDVWRGSKVAAIGSGSDCGKSLRDFALPYMQDLFDATRENVHLAIVRGALRRDDHRPRVRAGGLRPERQATAARDGRRQGSTRVRAGRPSGRCSGERPHALHGAHDRAAGTTTTSTDKGAPRRRRLHE